MYFHVDIPLDIYFIKVRRSKVGSGGFDFGIVRGECEAKGLWYRGRGTGVVVG